MQSLLKIVKTLCFTVVLFTLNLSAQSTGGIVGVVTDAETGRQLVGVSVLLKPLNIPDLTDGEGRFRIFDIKPGVYSLELRADNYKRAYIPMVKVNAGSATVLTIGLVDSLKTQVGSVFIFRNKNNTGSTQVVANERKNAPTVVDGLAGDVIKRTPDRSSADAIRRISSLTLQDNKFPVIRGLADRYNMALMNGVPLPSTLPDKRAFALDVIPSNFLDNILVVKGATAEHPGEFAGGLILINTRDVPDETTRSFTLGHGFMTNTIGKSFLYQTNRNSLDWIGLGASNRALPTGMPNTATYQDLAASERAEFSKNFDNDWGLNKKNNLGGMQMQFSNSSRFLFLNKETGLLFSLGYSNISQAYNLTQNQFDNNGSITVRNKDSQYTNNTLAGALLNFSMKIDRYNKLSFRNQFSTTATEDNSIREGNNNSTNTFEKSYQYNYSQNTLFTTSLAGDHYFKSQEFRIKWIAGYQNVTRNSPGNRRLLYTRQLSNPNDTLRAAISNFRSFQRAGKIYLNNTENVRFASYSLVKSTFMDFFKGDFKVGGFHQIKDREFGARILTYRDNSVNTPNGLKILGPGGIFNPQNFGGNGFRIDEIADPSYQYTGYQTLNAVYGMADVIFYRFLRLTAGIRLENFTQKMETGRNNGDTIRPTVKQNILLPSASLTLILSPKTNLRLGFANTVARPDFREISPFSYFDFVNFIAIEGFDSLQASVINNFDIRFETYPGDGQSFSVGGFYKNINNPIEQVTKPVANDVNRNITYRNSKTATIYGGEIEYRLKLNKLSKVLSDFIWSANAAIMFSEVVTESRKRPLQGQSPFVVNSSLFYTNRKIGFSYTLSYNLVGPRIFSVGNTQIPDFYENSRHVLDLQLAQNIGKKWEIKLNFADLLAQNSILYQNSDNNKGLDKSKDKIVNEFKPGRMIIFAITYKFK